MGDYCLSHAVCEGQLTRTWEAKQISIDRTVMLEVLKQAAAEDADCVEAFLEDVRAKAPIKHPGIGVVYEAVSNDEATFYAREKLAGKNLEDWYEEGKRLTPAQLVPILEQLAETMLYLEEKGVGCAEMGLHHLVSEDGERLKMMNLAVAGERDAENDTKAKQMLGAIFDEMLIDNHPGATRVRSLLAFMSDLDREHPLTWKQILKLSRQVKGQLQTAGISCSFKGDQGKRQEQKKKTQGPWVVMVLGCLGVLGLVAFFASGESESSPKEERSTVVEEEVLEGLLPKGSLLPDGTETKTDLYFGVREVSIGDYAAFLRVEDLSDFRHASQPASKTSHIPDGWSEALMAVSSKKRLEGRKFGLISPVTGIDWWDAYAYARWAGGRLPSVAEWQGAAGFQGAPRGPAIWGEDLTAETSDINGIGLYGMAGSVREWVFNEEENIEVQLAPAAPVALGGSYLEPGEGVGERLTLDSRGERQPDLGVRIVREKKAF